MAYGMLAWVRAVFFVSLSNIRYLTAMVLPVMGFAIVPFLCNEADGAPTSGPRSSIASRAERDYVLSSSS